MAQLAIGAAEVVVSRNLDQATQVQLIEDYINQVAQSTMSGPGEDRQLAYATALFDVARSEGSLAEVEDELFRFARTLEANDDLRTTLTDAGLPVEPPPADPRGPARRQGQPAHHGAAHDGGRRRSLPRPPQPSSRSSSG